VHLGASARSREWMSRAACRGTPDPGLFFPVGTGSAAAEEAEKAKAVCARCPVRISCLAYALSTRQQYGVWGGATEQERRLTARARNCQTSS
jgi:WhiB family transcriptional regulator, redox-sensing transcriptional regulator